MEARMIMEPRAHSECKSWKRKMKGIRAALECATRQLRRMDSTEDPVMRYRLPLEVIRMITDIGLSLGKMSIEDETELHIERAEHEAAEGTPGAVGMIDGEISAMREECESLVGVISVMQDFLEEFGTKFSEWVSQPHFSPDQFLGKEIMEDSRRDFKTRLE